MTQEFIDRLFAAVLGYCPYLVQEGCNDHDCPKDAKCPENDWSWFPSSDGEITKEVRDWFAKEMPGEWEKYLRWVENDCIPETWPAYSTVLDAQLSIANLAQYIVEHYKEMFMEECPDKNYGDDICITDSMLDCPVEGGCHGTGLILKPEMAEAVRVIEGEKK